MSTFTILKTLTEPKKPSYLFLLLPQTVPHGRHDLGDLSESRVGVLSLNSCLCVPEEQSVGRHRFLGLVGILLLLPLLPPSCSSFPSRSRGDAGGRRRQRGFRRGGIEGDDSRGDGQRDRGFD